MLDDLRNSAEASYLDEDQLELENQLKPKETRFLGMTAAQRFILSVLLFIMVVVMGTLLLLVSGKMVLP